MYFFHIGYQIVDVLVKMLQPTLVALRASYRFCQVSCNLVPAYQECILYL